MMTAQRLLVQDLQVKSPDGRILLDLPNFEVAAGQSVALRGASGAGKSTLLHVLSGLVRPNKGQVAWGAQDIAGLSEDARARFRREHLGLIFQDGHLFEELSAIGNAVLASAFAPAADRPAIRACAADWLRRLGLGQAGPRKADSFSGGERQRIAVARALAGSPGIILADEPTAALDRANADLLGADLVRLASGAGCTLVTVTHDEALAARMGRSVTLADGKIVEDSHV